MVGDVRDGVEKFHEAEVEMVHHQNAEEQTAAHQQHRLDDLHPRGGQHAAEDHVNNHEDAHPDDRDVEADARKQELDQRARADHLGDHVKDGDGQGAQRGHGADRALFEAIGQQVGHGVFARIAQGFGHDQQHRQVGDQPAHGIHESVVAKKSDHAGNAQKAGRAHVIAGHGEAVLPSGNAATRREIRA